MLECARCHNQVKAYEGAESEALSLHQDTPECVR
jgi:hypothetical protein